VYRGRVRLIHNRELGADLYVPRVSCVIVITGLLFLMGGWGLVRLLGFPLFLLILMFPLPDC